MSELDAVYALNMLALQADAKRKAAIESAIAAKAKADKAREDARAAQVSGVKISSG